MALGVGPGMEVVLPSFTFVSCATAIVRCGARPVFVDIDPDTLMLDPEAVEQAMTPHTRAILCVHYGGFPCAMDRLLEVATRHGVSLVEDAAQALGSRWRSRPLGTLGHIGCLSFHGTKNVTCGEGGAFLTQDERLANRALLIREKGTDREAFLRREVDRYTWVEAGGSFVLSDLLASLLLAQLKRLDAIQRERHAIALRYLAQLQPLAATGRLQLPRVQDASSVNWHLFYVILRSEAERDRVLKGLKEAGIGASFHFIPLHSSPYARERYGYRAEDLPVTERVAQRLIRLPIYPGLSPDAQERVITTLQTLLE